MFKVLVIEDDCDIRKIVCDYYIANGYSVVEAVDGKDGIEKFNSDLDLIVLDIMMPIIDGWSVCRRIRAKSDVPIIILTARLDEEDELQGFELRANDYIRKPFSPAVLIARSEQLLNRNRTDEDVKDELLCFEGLSINLSSRVVMLDGVEVQLTLKEFEILYYLACNKGIVLSREQIIKTVWGYEYFVDTRVIDNHIKKLRKALKVHSTFIKTVFGVGYKFEVSR